MHLLATTSGVIDGAAEAIDLEQSPADVVVLTAADSEIASLASAYDSARHPTLRLANVLQLQHNLSVDLYIEKTLSKARLIVLRLLGGEGYWRYGLEQVEALARSNAIMLAILPGDAQPDAELTARSTLPAHHAERLRQYLIAGGTPNSQLFLDYCQHLLSGTPLPAPAEPLAAAGVFARSKGRHHVGLIFYRSLLEGSQVEPITALMASLEARGIGCTAVFVTSLKDSASAAKLSETFKADPPALLLNATSFAASSGAGGDPLAPYDCPVLQVVLSSLAESSWRKSSQGLGARDLAMNVVLPELDGRIHTRAISFKSDSFFHEATQCRVVTHRHVPDRVEFVAELAANWLSLREARPADRKVAIILANYPDKDGRIANGVGYDTPASTIAMLKAMQTQDYHTGTFPENGNAIIAALQTTRKGDNAPTLSLDNYAACFARLPYSVREQITERWGIPEADPVFRHGAFHLSVNTFGNVAIAIQPARGYGIDPKSTYHDAALVPPHGYLAFYFWMQFEFGAHVIVHNGKHGNLEWLPGKANGLSQDCYPEIAHGPLPQLYPFIVNDPGEGTQAKRRTSAVIIDHLTPPLTRAETYGPLKDLEALVDEYYLASGLDRRRQASLKRDILALTRHARLDLDAGFTGDDDDDLNRLDSYLCDLKEAQIRDGLHILGHSPAGRQETDLLVALARVPRGLGEAGNQSLIRALAEDFAMDGFDPLSCNMADPWKGERPPALLKLLSSAWRTHGDTVERLEHYAHNLLSAGKPVPAAMPRTALVVEQIENMIRPALSQCGARELEAFLAGLDGRRVAPGPSGAPTRGRLDVLPTGRNFYSLDNRTVPTPTAWNLGQKSAELLLQRHFQDTGQYPRSIGLSAWGTSNMRTGGDDVAQCLALIGAKPVWEPSSWRVTGYEIIRLAVLGRPRVDVTLRISGFFRDAFPAQIELLDRAMRAVGALDEDDGDNPMAARMKLETNTLSAAGLGNEEAMNIAGYRIFGSKPGAYGAGLQTLIDEKIWDTRSDLAAAYVTWGSYAYGAGQNGINDPQAFTKRLKNLEAVIHNQDNREHDLLDSDDYYQFEGGMSAAVEASSGNKPRVYHNDHSRPERPVIRTLEEEVGRIMRSRVVNPKWIDGVKRHAYRGAFEIAATVDYMFAFAATTGAVKTHHFDLAFDAFVGDAETRQFISENNPAALREIAARFEEAATRGLWTPRLNSAYDLLRELQHD